MTALTNHYFSEIAALLQRIVDEETPAIEQAANKIADAIANGHKLFAFGASHSSLPVQDVMYRAGGLMLFNPLYGPGIDAMTTRPATLGSQMEQMPGFAKAILDNSPLSEGDVLIVISVSGRNAVPIEMAQLAQERGIYVIGVTSHAYTDAVTSRHESGKKMKDFCDLVLDNKVDAGDAVLSIEGFERKFTPASGITTTALMHAISGATIEALVNRGITPPVFLAANLDGGKEWNAKLLKENADRIFYL
jgi:uncharacterized phosphosugar-binding protein